MTTSAYLAALDAKLQEMTALITSSIIQREIDPNIEIGFISGQVIFVDGSRLEFSEQLPVARCKYRLQYMNADNQLIARWDSAPHHKQIDTFPFHKHTLRGVESHTHVTMLEILDQIGKGLKV